MSIAPGHHSYFLRVGASTRPMVDFEVRDMLRIKTIPQLSVGYVFRRVAISATETYEIALTLANVSEISAYHAYLIIDHTDLTPFHEKYGNFSGFALAHQRHGFRAATETILHPGFELPVAATPFEVSRNHSSDIEVRLQPGQHFKFVTDLPPIQVVCRIGCENSPARQVTVLVSSSELEEAIDKATNNTIPGRQRF